MSIKEVDINFSKLTYDKSQEKYILMLINDIGSGKDINSLMCNMIIDYYKAKENEPTSSELIDQFTQILDDKLFDNSSLLVDHIDSSTRQVANSLESTKKSIDESIQVSAYNVIEKNKEIVLMSMEDLRSMSNILIETNRSFQTTAENVSRLMLSSGKSRDPEETSTKTSSSPFDDDDDSLFDATTEGITRTKGLLGAATDILNKVSKSKPSFKSKYVVSADDVF